MVVYFELFNIVINFLEENKSKNIDLERFNNFVNEFNDVKKKNNLELILFKDFYKLFLELQSNCSDYPRQLLREQEYLC